MQSNRIVESRQNLTSKEKKLLIQLILNLSSYSDNLECIINSDEFFEILGDDKNNKKRNIENLIAGFQTKACYIKQADESWKRYIWCPTAEFDSKSKTIKMRLNSDLKDDFIGLKKYFTQYSLEDVLSVHGYYTVRIYELLMNKRKSENIRWSCILVMDELRPLILGSNSKSYARPYDFYSKVILKSIDEINKNTHLNITYEEYTYKGKTVTSIKAYMELRILKKIN